jgi:hypothetical protein
LKTGHFNYRCLPFAIIVPSFMVWPIPYYPHQAFSVSSPTRFSSESSDTPSYSRFSSKCFAVETIDDSGG